MFTGIIETLGKVKAVNTEGTNINLVLQADFVKEIKVDQSIAHNGVCLTVADLKKDRYTVTAIHETLIKTNLSQLAPGDIVNLERCVKLGDRLDGHLVQGHVDCTAICKSIKQLKGSWYYTFECDKKYKQAKKLMVAKGSICVNGVSLTIVECKGNTFSVAIIPYTFEHTTFKTLKKDQKVNIEFDIIGKYILKIT